MRDMMAEPPLQVRRTHATAYAEEYFGASHDDLWVLVTAHEGLEVYEFVQVEHELLFRLVRQQRSGPSLAFDSSCRSRKKMGLNHTQCSVEG